MSRSRNTGPLDCKVYIGDLGNNGDRGEIEHAFGRFGPLKNVWVARNPPGFAFVEFEDARDAEDASRDMDGRNLCGRRVRVELSNGRSKSKRGFGERDGGGRDRDYGRGGNGYGSRDGRDRGGRDDRPPRRRSRSRSPPPRGDRDRNGDSKRERMESGSPEPERKPRRRDSGSPDTERKSRRSGRGDSEDKNGSPGSKD